MQFAGVSMQTPGSSAGRRDGEPEGGPSKFAHVFATSDTVVEHGDQWGRPLTNTCCCRKVSRQRSYRCRPNHSRPEGASKTPSGSDDLCFGSSRWRPSLPRGSGRLFSDNRIFTGAGRAGRRAAVRASEARESREPARRRPATEWPARGRRRTALGRRRRRRRAAPGEHPGFALTLRRRNIYLPRPFPRVPFPPA